MAEKEEKTNNGDVAPSNVKSDTVRLTGQVRWIERDAQTGELIREWSHPNLITVSGGLALLQQFLIGRNPGGLSYFAVGSGIETVGRFWTSLPTEVFRTPIAKVEPVVGPLVPPGTVSIEAFSYLGVGDCAGDHVGQIALVGGQATDAPNSGALFAVSNEPQPFHKDLHHTYTCSWTITLSGVVA